MNYKQRVGYFGEDLASKYLIKRGYRIIERNKKISYQEIDIIAKFKKTIIFIEVKTRTGNYAGFAEESINRNKIRNIKRAITRYAYFQKINLDNTQFDVITVNIQKIQKIAKIKHYINIF